MVPVNTRVRNVNFSYVTFGLVITSITFGSGSLEFRIRRPFDSLTGQIVSGIIEKFQITKAYCVACYNGYSQGPLKITLISDLVVGHVDFQLAFAHGGVLPLDFEVAGIGDVDGVEQADAISMYG